MEYDSDETDFTRESFKGYRDPNKKRKRNDDNGWSCFKKIAKDHPIFTFFGAIMPQIKPSPVEVSHGKKEEKRRKKNAIESNREVQKRKKANDKLELFVAPKTVPKSKKMRSKGKVKIRKPKRGVWAVSSVHDFGEATNRHEKQGELLNLLKPDKVKIATARKVQDWLQKKGEYRQKESNRSLEGKYVFLDALRLQKKKIHKGKEVPKNDELSQGISSLTVKEESHAQKKRRKLLKRHDLKLTSKDGSLKKDGEETQSDDEANDFEYKKIRGDSTRENFSFPGTFSKKLKAFSIEASEEIENIEDSKHKKIAIDIKQQQQDVGIKKLSFPGVSTDEVEEMQSRTYINGEEWNNDPTNSISNSESEASDDEQQEEVSGRKNGGVENEKKEDSRRINEYDEIDEPLSVGEEVNVEEMNTGNADGVFSRTELPSNSAADSSRKTTADFPSSSLSANELFLSLDWLAGIATSSAVRIPSADFDIPEKPPETPVLTDLLPAPTDPKQIPATNGQYHFTESEPNPGASFSMNRDALNQNIEENQRRAASLMSLGCLGARITHYDRKQMNMEVKQNYGSPKALFEQSQMPFNATSLLNTQGSPLQKSYGQKDSSLEISSNVWSNQTLELVQQSQKNPIQMSFNATNLLHTQGPPLQKPCSQKDSSLEISSNKTVEPESSQAAPNLPPNPTSGDISCPTILESNWYDRNILTSLFPSVTPNQNSTPTLLESNSSGNGTQSTLHDNALATPIPNTNRSQNTGNNQQFMFHNQIGQNRQIPLGNACNSIQNFTPNLQNNQNDSNAPFSAFQNVVTGQHYPNSRLMDGQNRAFAASLTKNNHDPDQTQNKAIVHNFQNSHGNAQNCGFPTGRNEYLVKVVPQNKLSGQNFLMETDSNPKNNIQQPISSRYDFTQGAFMRPFNSNRGRDCATTNLNNQSTGNATNFTNYQFNTETNRPSFNLPQVTPQNYRYVSAFDKSVTAIQSHQKASLNASNEKIPDEKPPHSNLCRNCNANLPCQPNNLAQNNGKLSSFLNTNIRKSPSHLMPYHQHNQIMLHGFGPNPYYNPTSASVYNMEPHQLVYNLRNPVNVPPAALNLSTSTYPTNIGIYKNEN